MDRSTFDYYDDINHLISYLKGLLPEAEREKLEKAMADDPILRQIVAGLEIDLVKNGEPSLRKFLDDSLADFRTSVLGKLADRNNLNLMNLVAGLFALFVFMF